MQSKIYLSVSVLLTLMISSPFLVKADITYCSSTTFSGVDAEGYPIGDINGDKIEDFALVYSSGTIVYIVLGRRTGFPSNLNVSTATNADGVIKITGSSGFGSSFSSAGDINNDGYDDVMIGSQSQKKVYILYGKSSWSDMAISSFASGTDGFQISNSAGSAFGSYVNKAGDINGDGKNDLLIAGGSPDNTIHIIFGATSMTDIDVTTMSKSVGIKISGSNALKPGGESSAYADLNHDGRTDLILSDDSKKQIIVIFGGPALNDNIDVSTMSATTGVLITSSFGVDFGHVLTNAHDLNDDGVDDLLVSDFVFSKAFIIFGKSNFASFDVDVNVPSTTRIKLLRDPADTSNTLFGKTLTYAEDINQDGKADAFVSSNSRVYAIYGGSSLNSQVSITFSNTTAQIIDSTTDTSRDYAKSTFLADLSGDGVKELYFVGFGKTFQLVKGYTTTPGGTCYPCSESCLSCTDANTCTACAQGKTLSGSNCSCTNAQYFSTSTSTCTACSTLHASCTTCTNANTCTACSNGKKPTGNTCVDIVCSSGQYLSGFDCLACPANCKKCKDGVTCTECLEDYVLENSVCVVGNSLKGWQIALIAVGSIVISVALLFVIWKVFIVKILGSKTKVVAMNSTKVSVAANP